MLRTTHDGASNQGIQGYIQLSVLLVAGVLGQQAEALPLPAVLRDDGHLPGVVSENGIKHAKPVTAAIVLWNTVYLERATSALRAHGKALDDTLLQYLSPLGWEHINLTGDYLWRSSAKVGAGKFRPLRPLPPA